MNSAMVQDEVVICTPQRPAIGTFGGTMKAVLALGAAMISAVLSRSGLPGNAFLLTIWYSRSHPDQAAAI